MGLRYLMCSAYADGGRGWTGPWDAGVLCPVSRSSVDEYVLSEILCEQQSGGGARGERELDDWTSRGTRDWESK